MHEHTPLFNEEKYTVLLPVDSSRFDSAGLEASAVENGFTIQKEFHITLLGFAIGQKIQDSLKSKTSEEQASVKAKIHELISTTDWSYTPRKELYALSKQYPKEIKKSYIQLVDLPCTNKFFDALSEILDMSLDLPVPHVTLYSKSTDGKGIGINSLAEFISLSPTLIHRESGDSEQKISKIIIPSEVQVDTAVSLFILKKFGIVHFAGIETASIEMKPTFSPEQTEAALFEKGIILVDVGMGKFDHHGKTEKVTSSELISSYLGLSKYPALDKLRQLAQRDDFFGKGTLSTDPLDKAFGLPQLIVNLNKKYKSDPNLVMNIIFPLLDAHYFQEERRTIDLPKEFEDKMKAGEVETFSIAQAKHKLKAVYVASDNTGLAGYLRSQGGGRYDVVIIHLSSRHINILTRPISPTKRIDLRQLTAVVRRAEMMKRKDPTLLSYEELSQPGRSEKVPEWYFDPATNSLQNGGINPSQTKRTELNRKEIVQLVDVGLANQVPTEYY